MSIPYTKKMFCERVVKHINDGFPNNDFKITQNEVLLYLDSAIPSVLKGQMFDNAKISQVLDVPEAYLVTYTYTVTLKQKSTNEWYVTLAQTPMALPNGYQVTDAYFSSNVGRTMSVNFVSVKRQSYKSLLAQPPVVNARIEGQTCYMQSYNGFSLLNQTFNIQFPISRTSDVNAPMNLPDEAITGMFEYTTKKIIERYSIPKDTVEDSLPAGNKTS